MFEKDQLGKLEVDVARGGRPATTISSPSHILLIFSSEPPRNSRSSNIIKIKTFKKNNIERTRILRWLGQEIVVAGPSCSSEPQCACSNAKIRIMPTTSYKLKLKTKCYVVYYAMYMSSVYTV